MHHYNEWVHYSEYEMLYPPPHLIYIINTYSHIIIYTYHHHIHIYIYTHVSLPPPHTRQYSYIPSLLSLSLSVSVSLSLSVSIGAIHRSRHVVHLPPQHHTRPPQVTRPRVCADHEGQRGCRYGRMRHQLRYCTGRLGYNHMNITLCGI